MSIIRYHFLIHVLFALDHYSLHFLRNVWWKRERRPVQSDYIQSHAEEAHDFYCFFFFSPKHISPIETENSEKRGEKAASTSEEEKMTMSF